MADTAAGGEACAGDRPGAGAVRGRLRLWSPATESPLSRLEVSPERVISVGAASRRRQASRKPRLWPAAGPRAMDLDRAALALAGVMVLAGVALAWLVNPAFIWLTVAAGVTILQGALTGLSITARLLRAFGVKPEQQRRRTS